MRLVYLSPVPWASFAQRPQKFVEWFQRRHGEPVLWIEPYPTRFPRINDVRRVVVPPEPSVTPQPDWLTVLRPMALPLEPVPGSGWLNRNLWRDVLKRVDQIPQDTRDVLVIGKPSVLALHLLARRHWHATAYDAMDNFPAFYSGVSRMAMARRELHVAKKVAHVWTSSTALQEQWRQHRSDIQLIRNGLDASALPAWAQRSPRHGPRILGYVGTIADWFDWDWVIALAHSAPEDTVRLIGPVFSALPSKLPGNIEILPPCAHAQALQAMADFDVGLIPFKRTVLTACVDPIKFYEYRAMGLPVLSTVFGEMRYHQQESGVFICGPEDIAVQAAHAMGFAHEPDASSFVAANSWDARFSQIRSFG